jgi:hypothetical protein
VVVVAAAVANVDDAIPNIASRANAFARRLDNTSYDYIAVHTPHRYVMRDMKKAKNITFINNVLIASFDCIIL